MLTEHYWQGLFESLSNEYPSKVKLYGTGRLECHAELHCSYNGVPFIYKDDSESYSYSIDDEGDPNSWWWTEGNGWSNPTQYLPDELKQEKIPVDENKIILHRVVPFDSRLPTLDVDIVWLSLGIVNIAGER